jgi:hypothetical protein
MHKYLEMNFKTLLSKLFEDRSNSEAFSKTGDAVAKDRAKASTSDLKAKDAARKRAERARQIPRERKPKAELVKEVIAVRTKSGRVQLIFKDSFNADNHTKISDQELSLADAKQLTGDPKFEQTRASILLLGDVKGPGEKEEKKEKSEKKEEKKEPKKEKSEEAKQEKPKAKKLSPEEMMQSMAQMTPEQLATMPPDVRTEYFKSVRNPPTNTDFDHLSYEELSVKYGINPASDLPYSQQVLNALVFLAKTKAGASDQEMATYTALAPAAMEFTREAFAQARKILSQIGDQCIQNLVSTIEAGMKSVNSEGMADMQCGNYKFKVNAGGEMSISTTSFDQSNKNFRGFLGSALTAAIQSEFAQPSNEKTMEVISTIQELSKPFGSTLISNDNLSLILTNPKYVKKLQETPIVDDEGNDLGMVLDDQGNLNPAASFENYQQELTKANKSLLKAIKETKQSQIMQRVSDSLLKMILRGDGIVAPEMAPTHLITMNGVFPMTDPFFAEISKTATLESKPAKDTITNSNISTYKSASAEKLRSYRSIIEAKQEAIKQPKLEELINDKQSIDVASMLTNSILSSFDFDFNASLLPGFSPKDLNSIEFNYVTIDGKVTKIPVVRNEKIATKLIGEGLFVVNDILIESLTNNFVLSSLVKSGLINEIEAKVLYDGPVSLLECSDAAYVNLKTIYDNVNIRINEEPDRLSILMNLLLDEEAERDYKQEYRNYHGKPKQRKERAARTKARELMKKKGIVRKGDGKDIDHKKPLRSGGSNGINNLRVRSKSDNRADNGHKKGEKQNKDWK